ncbi:SDR family oxidoreductase [Enemella evansiae]|uniref:Short-chain dehydrogenase n=1 Tax=Enemella evansiae TaxID=2016499 RepID=A0A255GDT6_9ACTN|nr:SDR family oxidoreductase [Enemella evansiae]PFG68207.1 short-subunit dehydrogenase [Propionibacteriaceae bacterium ES.041]OYO01045.1 short-chain dehydrogenase [Enemella evansiae]OYO03155.1 short-chain dehydrogenase [Enemella evansiae]OYO03838.1 short-chain dehydrogenase [Enemella evansiae]OYO08124.1 short-chain dehydrogenase [Enemella evansiae]
MTERVVVVTGAGSGIGRTVAADLLGRGHTVVLAGRRAEALNETVAGVESAAERALAVPTDVTDPSQVARLFASVEEAFGRCDVLFNNAGSFGPPGAVDEISAADWDEIWKVNVSGPVFCAGAAVRLMRRTGGGRIINNASISAHVPRPQSVAYTTTKHAITGLTRSITLDGRADNISATRLDIGNAATAMTSGMVQALQPDGSRRAEPTFDPAHVATLIADLVALPFEVAVPELMVMANGMPFAGRG